MDSSNSLLFLFLFRQKKKEKKAPEIDNSPISVVPWLGFTATVVKSSGSLVHPKEHFGLVPAGFSRLRDRVKIDFRETPTLQRFEK